MRDAATQTTDLEEEHLFRLFMARNWLAIGGLEEARREFQSLPPHAQMHPAARAVRQQLFARRQDDEGHNK
jgi:hypothetical protein